MVSVELRLFDSLDSGQGDSVEIIGGITHGFTNGFHKIRELFVSENNNENQWKPDNKLLKRLIKGLNGKKYVIYFNQLNMQQISWGFLQNKMFITICCALFETDVKLFYKTSMHHLQIC